MGEAGYVNTVIEPSWNHDETTIEPSWKNDIALKDNYRPIMEPSKKHLQVQTALSKLGPDSAGVSLSLTKASPKKIKTFIVTNLLLIPIIIIVQNQSQHLPWSLSCQIAGTYLSLSSPSWGPAMVENLQKVSDSWQSSDKNDDEDDDDDQERVLWCDGEGGETPLQHHWPSGR